MRSVTLFAGAAFMLAVASAGPAGAQERQQSGTLTCEVGGGVGFIVGSEKPVQCVYRPDGPGRPELYAGRITRAGVDIGVTAGSRIVWGVSTRTTVPRGALAGIYSGPSAEATVGAGLGANFLVGGSNRSISLQPLSVQAQTGLNVSVGVTGLELAPAGPTAVRQARVRGPRAGVRRGGIAPRLRGSRVRSTRVAPRSRMMRGRPMRARAAGRVRRSQR